MRKEQFVFVIHPREKNRESNKEERTQLVLREQIWWREATTDKNKMAV